MGVYPGLSWISPGRYTTCPANDAQAQGIPRGFQPKPPGPDSSPSKSRYRWGAGSRPHLGTSQACVGSSCCRAAHAHGGAPLDGRWGGTTTTLMATHITRVSASSSQVSQSKAHTPAFRGRLGKRHLPATWHSRIGGCPPMDLHPLLSGLPTVTDGKCCSFINYKDRSQTARTYVPLSMHALSC